MIKVLHVLNELRPSGAETMLALAAPHWKSMGFELTVLSTGEQCGLFADRLKEAGFEVKHLPFRKSMQFFLQLVPILRSFDAVHIHTERGAFEYALAARLAGVPRVARTIHSHFEFYGWTCQVRAIGRRLSAWLGVQQISIGASVARNERERFGNRTTTIVNWFDEKRFRPPNAQERTQARALLNLNPGQWALVSVGNCSHAKNHEAILQAMPLLPEAVYFHLGSEDQDQSERDLACRLGVLDRVKFLGPGDPVNLLWGADIYVMPSRYEGFGIAALEAAATGITCVLANVAGLKDLKGVLPNILLADTESHVLREALEHGRSQVRLTDTRTLGQLFGSWRGAVAYAALWGYDPIGHIGKE